MEVTTSENFKMVNKNGYGKEVIYDSDGKITSIYEGMWKDNSKHGDGIVK
jgi:hypothetical protein